MHASDVTAVFPLAKEAETQGFGAVLATLLQPGMVIFLEGDLGAGKTTLARALIRALGHSGAVKSPTYALVEHYVISSLYLYHFDFYRFESPDEFLDAGFGEYFNDVAICLVEWPDRAGPYLPPPDLRLRLHHAGAARVLEVRAETARGVACVSTATSTWPAADSSGPSAPA